MISKLGPMRGMASRDHRIPENLEHFAKYFGEDAAELESEMVDYLVRQNYTSPVVDYIHYVGTVEYLRGGKTVRHACFFHTQNKVKAWSKVVVGQMNKEQIDGAVWDLKEFQSRAEASRYIRRFLK